LDSGVLREMKLALPQQKDRLKISWEVTGRCPKDGRVTVLRSEGKPGGPGARGVAHDAGDVGDLAEAELGLRGPSL